MVSNHSEQESRPQTWMVRVRETVGDARISRRQTTNKKDRHSLDKIECTKADNRMREGRQGDRNPRIGRQRQAKYEVETFIDDQA